MIADVTLSTPSEFVDDKRLPSFRKGAEWAAAQMDKEPELDLARFEGMSWAKLKKVNIEPPEYTVARRLIHKAAKNRSGSIGPGWRAKNDRAFWLGVRDASTAVMEWWLDSDRLVDYQQEVRFSIVG